MAKPRDNHGRERFEEAIPGFGMANLADFDAVRDRDPNPSETFIETRDALLRFVGSRDPVMFLARTGLHLLVSLADDAEGKEPRFEQAEAELLQSLALTMPRGPEVPTSPRNMVRGWELATRNMRAYPGFAFPEKDLDAAANLSRQARIQTLHYRNIFNSDDAKAIVPALLTHMDDISDRVLGYRLSDFSRALFRLLDLVGSRTSAFARVTRSLYEGRFDEVRLDRVARGSPMARRAWRFAENRIVSPEGRAWAAFQLSELNWARAFTFTRSKLERLFGNKICSALFNASITFGELADLDSSTFYLESPIRQRPFIRISDDILFLPLPVLVVSFPFAIVEAKLHGHPQLAEAYAAARTRYLENSTAELVGTALPSATVYRSVHWDDPETGRHYENDTVVTIGNHVFLFEAKSGKLKPASRRGGESSLRKNLRDLYVEPGRQAARLETLLRRGRDAEKLLQDRHGKPLAIDLSRPTVVHSFGVCIESLGAITSNRRHFEAIGLLAESDPWAPVLSIGEIRMLCAYLDTEVSFFHYLTRRTSIEQLIDFTGDEQDLLSLYLTNGFQMDVEAIKGVRIIFTNADKPVRGLKIARPDRTEFHTPGIFLPPLWKRITSEIYQSPFPHRFDTIETILNHHPATMQGLEAHTRRWNGGMGRGDQGLRYTRVEIGDRIFTIGLLLRRTVFSSAESWQAHAREAARQIYYETDATECVIVLKIRKSKASFDAVSFFRFRRLSAAERTMRNWDRPGLL